MAGAKLTPTLLSPGKYRLDVKAFASEKGIELPQNSNDLQPTFQVVMTTSVRLKANEWARFRLLDDAGKFQGYQMLVQVIPVTDH